MLIMTEKQNCKNMETFSKDQFITKVQKLNSVIDSINTENCYDKVVEFFDITSYLQDHSEEIKALPLRGTRILFLKTFRRARSEISLEIFMNRLKVAGRCSYGHNRTEPGEPITKANIYFGNVWGICTYPIKRFEYVFKDSKFVQEHIRNQITEFVKSYKDKFNTDWVRWTIYAASFSLRIFIFSAFHRTKKCLTFYIKYVDYIQC